MENEKQALDFIAQIVQQAAMPLAGHQQAQKALQILKDLIDKKEEK